MGGWVCWCAWVSRRIYCVTKTIFRANWWCFQRNSVGSNLVGRFCFNVFVLLFWYILRSIYFKRSPQLAVELGHLCGLENLYSAKGE